MSAPSYKTIVGDSLTASPGSAEWALYRNDVVKSGVWRGQQLLEYRHAHYGTVIMWPATGTANFWVSAEASDNWSKKPHVTLCSNEMHGPGNIVYNEVMGLFAAIEAACIPANAAICREGGRPNEK